MHSSKSRSVLHQQPLVGSWIGDECFVVGDGVCPEVDEWLDRYVDIGGDLVQMLAVVSPELLFEWGGVEWMLALAEDWGELGMTPETKRSVADYLRATKSHYVADDYSRLIQCYEG